MIGVLWGEERSSDAMNRRLKFMTVGLDADRFVAADASIPHEFCDGCGDDDPRGLDEHSFVESGFVESFEKNGNREVEFVGKDGVFCQGREGGGEKVEWEYVAAEEVFEGVKEEDDGRNFEKPEREHGQRVGDEELDECCHGGREREPEPGFGMPGKMDGCSQGPEYECDDRKSYCGVKEAAGEEEA